MVGARVEPPTACSEKRESWRYEGEEGGRVVGARVEPPTAWRERSG